MAAPAKQHTLCQGNFELWRDSVNQQLELHDLEVWDFYHARQYAFGAINTQNISGIDSAVDIILRNVDPHILSTVSRHFKSHPYALWKHLHQYSRPFRFLDLPAELREKIIVQSFEPEVVHPGEALPSILQASQQLRAESRKLYYQNHHFYLDFEAEAADRDQVEDNCETRVQFLTYWVKKWIADEVGTAIKHLRHITLYIEESGFAVRLLFSSKEDRLYVQLEQVDDTALYELDEEALVGLGEYVDMIEQRRKDGHSEKGGSIIDALLHTPQTWGHGVIPMKEEEADESEEDN